MKRLLDFNVVDHVMRHADIYPHISDDFAVGPDEFSVAGIIENEDVYFLGRTIDDRVAGVFFYHPHNRALYEVHSAVLPDFRGKTAVKMAADSLAWMFGNTECRKVITNVPEYNVPAIAIAKRAGMRVEGINRASIMKNGTMIDQIILGITKEESLCLQQQ